MTSRLLSPSEIQNILKTARRAGFTKNSLTKMLIFLGLKPTQMDHDDYRQVLPYINNINARKFNDRRTEI